MMKTSRHKTVKAWCNVHNAELAVVHYGFLFECAASLRDSDGRIDECMFVSDEGDTR